MKLDYSSFYGIFANPEPVTLISVANDADVISKIATAYQFPITTKEQAASFGAYTGTDLIWTIPAPLLPTGVTPKPRDRVRTAAGTEYTCLSLTYTPMTGRYSLTTRNLVLAYDLRDTIDIKRSGPLTAPDKSGNTTSVYSTVYAQVPAKIQDVGGNVEDVQGKQGIVKKFRAMLGQQVNVTTADQVVFGNTIYQITGASNPDRIDELMALDLEILP